MSQIVHALEQGVLRVKAQDYTISTAVTVQSAPWRGQKKEAAVKKMWLASLLIVSMGILPQSAWAQVVAQAAPPAELLLFTQEELAVTATRTSKPVSETPSATSVITHEEIKRSGLTHIPDILRRVPGVDVTTTTAGHSDVNIRGLNKALSARTLVLVDGRTVFINGQGFTPWEAIPLLVDDIERIEVVKGPVQALYGSPALSGVINVITRSPFDVNGFEFIQRYGAPNTVDESAIYGGKLGESVAYKVEGGWKTFGPFEGVNEGNRQGGVKRSTWGGAIDWKMADDAHTSVSAGFADGDFDILPSDATGMGPMKHKTDFIKLDTQIQGFQAQYFWNRYDFNVVTTNIDEDVTVDTHDVDLAQHLTVGPHTLLGGVGARYEQIDSNLFSSKGETKTEATWDLYAQDEWKLLDELVWYGTIRLDRHPISNYNIAFRSSLLYEPLKDHVIWGTVGHSFRNPTFSESKISLRFPSLPVPAISTVSVGNEWLSAENMTTLEVGYRSLWYDRVKLEAGFFYNRVADAIAAFSDPVDFTDPLGWSATANFKNVGKAYVLGTELGGEVFLYPWLSTFGSWTYQDTELEDGFPESDLSPKHKVVLGFSSTYKNFSGELFMQYVSAAAAPQERSGLADLTGKVDPFWWTSTRAGYALNDHAELALIVYNLFHDLHQEHAAGQELGTRIVVQANVKF